MRILDDLFRPKWERRMRAESRRECKKLLKERGIKEPIRCPSCGERHKNNKGRPCEGMAWFVQDADGRPVGVAVGLWIAYQRDLIIGPLFEMPDKDARVWYDRGGWTA